MPAFISDDSASGDSAEEEPFDATLLEKFVSATDPVTLPVPTATTVDEVLNVIVALAAPSEPARVRIMFKKIGQGFHDWTPKGWYFLDFVWKQAYDSDNKPILIKGELASHPVSVTCKACAQPDLTSAQGAFFSINPIDGAIHYNPRTHMNSSRSLESITSFAFAMLESDHAPGKLWLRLAPLLPFRVVMIVSSGGSSYHILVYLGAQSEAEWHSILDPARTVLAALGADRNTFRSVQLSRLPFCFRQETKRTQELIYLNPKPAFFPTSYKTVGAFITGVEETARKFGIVLNEGKRLPAADIAIWMQDQRPKTSAVKAYEDERRAAIVVIKEFRKQIRAGCFLQLDFKKAADLAPAPYNNEAEVKRLYEFYKAQFVVPLAFPNGLFAKIWKELRNDQKKKCGLDSCTRRFQSGTEIYKNLAHSYAALRDWNMYGDQAFSYLLSDKKRVRKFVVLWKTVLEIVRKALPDDSQWNPEKLAKDFLSNDHAHCEALFALDDPHVLAIVKATVFLILMELLQAHKSNIIRMSDLLDVIPYSDQTIRNAMDALVNTRYNVKKDGKNRSAHWIIPESFADLWRKENPYLDANAFVAASKRKPEPPQVPEPPESDDSVSFDECNEASIPLQLDMADSFGGLLPPIDCKHLGALSKMLDREEVIRRLASVEKALEPNYSHDQ